jgi:5-methylcytosine-specific restriction endonuclease McrA
MSVKKKIPSQRAGGVLVLNADYTPIGVSPLSRVLLKLSKPNSVYSVLEWDGDRTLNNGQYPIPSVVRLLYRAKVPFNKAVHGRMLIYWRDGYRCQFCAKKFSAAELTLDHILPKSRGGSNRPDNLVTACKSCNNRKGARTPEEARMPLLSPLSEYKVGLHKIQLVRYAEQRPEWQKWLFPGLEEDADLRAAV